jgi:hypothetical protein
VTVTDQTTAPPDAALPHLLVITGPCEERDPDTGECDTTPPHVHTYRWHVECPGVTDICRTWWACTECTPADLARFAEQGDDEAHGVQHQFISGCGWSVPAAGCYVQYAAAESDAVPDLDLDPGTYRIRHDYLGEPGEMEVYVDGREPDQLALPVKVQRADTQHHVQILPGCLYADRVTGRCPPTDVSVVPCDTANVTAIDDTAPHVHRFDVKVECPGVTDACRSWEDCDECTPEDEEAMDRTGDGWAHGVAHFRRGDEGWFVPGEDCDYRLCVYRHDARDMFQGHAPGTYPVSYVCDDASERMVVRVESDAGAEVGE